MAIEPKAYGYPKAEITADKLPVWQQPLSRFSVKGPNDWKVSVLSSIDRGIRIEAGTGSGDAVTDVTFDYETMSLPTPPTATAWYLIVRRRNWSGTGTSTLVAIRGTDEKKLPTRRDIPGEESDQPLALVRVTQKDRPVQEIIDLRCFASNGGVEVVDRLALSYLETPGAAVKLGADVWRYEPQGNGVWGWTDRVGSTAKQSIPLTQYFTPDPPREDGLQQEAPSVYREGRRVHLSGVASNTSDLTLAGGTVYGLGLLPAGYRPAMPEYFLIEVAFQICRVWVRPDGNIYLMFPTGIGALPPRVGKLSLSGISFAAAS